MAALKYLSGYPAGVVRQAQQLIDEGRLADHLLAKYPQCHGYRTNKLLYDYAVELKNRHLRTAPTLSKAVFDPRIHVIQHTLGLHVRTSRIQGSRLKAKYTIRVATLFRQAPQAFLDMILIHELAHFKESDHNKAFYQLCCHMDPDYHQMEFDLRLYLTCLDLVGEIYGSTGGPSCAEQG